MHSLRLMAAFSSRLTFHIIIGLHIMAVAKSSEGKKKLTKKAIKKTSKKIQPTKRPPSKQSTRLDAKPVKPPRQGASSHTKPQIHREVEPSKSGLSENNLSIKLSKSLLNRIKITARSEGLTVNELAVELLSDSVAVRSWEIIEKKQSLNKNNQGNNNNNHSSNRSNNYRKYNNNSHNNNNNNRGNRGGNRYNAKNNMMDDKAAFMDYVRKQEASHNR